MPPESHKEPPINRQYLDEADPKTVIECLKFLHENRAYYHRNLWEEERHYTWLIAGIFGAMLALVSQWGKIPLFLFGGAGIALSIFGWLISRLAFEVVKRECDSFQKAIRRFMIFQDHFFRRLYPEEDAGGALPPQKLIGYDRVEISEKVMLSSSFTARQAFLFTFVAFERIFVVTLLLAVLVLVVPSWRSAFQDSNKAVAPTPASAMSPVVPESRQP